MNRVKEESQISKHFPQEERYTQARVCVPSRDLLHWCLQRCALILYCPVLCQRDPWLVPYVFRSIQALLYNAVRSIWSSTHVQPQSIKHLCDTFIKSVCTTKEQSVEPISLPRTMRPLHLYTEEHSIHILSHCISLNACLVQ